MISAVFFMNAKGDVLISRVYRDDVNRTVATTFRNYIQETKDLRTPIKTIGSTTFFHIRIDTIYVVAVTRQNVNAALAFEVLNQLVELFEAYFKQIDEESIYANFVLIYELLDEVLDFGYPQHCSKDILQAFITQGKGRWFEREKEKAAADVSKITIRATGVVSWRNPELRYKRNQIYIDVIEAVNMLVSPKGTVLSQDVTGTVVLKTELSGMPECTLGMNDKAYLLAHEARRSAAAAASASSYSAAPVRRKAGSSGIAIEDVNFHQCVRLGKFDADRTISFIPPDGEFELMKYRTTTHINEPFRVMQNLKEVGHTRIEAHLTIMSTFSRELQANNIKILLPVPKNTAVCKVSVATGRARYLPEAAGVLWKIKRFPGKSEVTLAADIELGHVVTAKPSAAAAGWSRPPISMEFQVPMFTASGLQIRFLKVVEKSHYQTIKWVRYLTKNGSYQIRI
jgi:AP-2 complex subunit mu-1